MKLKNIGIILGAGLLVAALGMFGCSSNSGASNTSAANIADEATDEIVLVNDGKLTVAASLDFPPFENLNGTEAEGFEVDLMKALAEQMGLEAEYLPSTKFDTIIPLITAGGTADVGVSGFTVTEDRKKEIDFTDVIIDSNQGVVVMPDSGITNVDQLEGKTIATQSGTTGFDWAEENIPNANVKAYDEMTSVFAALQSGNADAIVADLPVVQYYVSHGYSDMEVLDPIVTGEQYAIVVSKDNPALTEQLNAALAELKANGTYEEIYEKWFGASAE